MLLNISARQGAVAGSTRHSCQLQSSQAQCIAAASAYNTRISISQLNTLARPVRQLVLLCASSNAANNSSSSGGKKKQKVKSPHVSNTSTVAAAAATATVAAAPITSSNSSTGAAGMISVVNPPLGFSNNIVPAAPLVVNTPRRSRTPDEYSSDESMDDESASALSSYEGRSIGRSAAYRCLVLDSRYLPVNVVSWFRAVCMDESGKVDVLEYYQGGYAYSAYKAHPLPAVLRVRTFVDVHEFAGRLSLTRKNIMLRDHHRCQYCGSHRDLTLDHVTPVCRGGMNTWTNLVTACMACNQRKGDKSLAQMGWTLPCLPREPTPQEVGVIAGISKSDMESPPQPWVAYLATYKAMLDKAQRRAASAAAATAYPVHRSGSSSSSSSNSGVDESSDSGFSVTVHAAGPASKAAKAAAAAAATGGGVKSGSSKGAKAAAAAAGKKVTKVSSRHL